MEWNGTFYYRIFHLTYLTCLSWNNYFLVLIFFCRKKTWTNFDFYCFCKTANVGQINIYLMHCFVKALCISKFFISVNNDKQAIFKAVRSWNDWVVTCLPSVVQKEHIWQKLACLCREGPGPSEPPHYICSCSDCILGILSIYVVFFIGLDKVLLMLKLNVEFLISAENYRHPFMRKYFPYR